MCGGRRSDATGAESGLGGSALDAWGNIVKVVYVHLI